ncbi:hypothetical protein SAMN02745168_2238 [Papillibacter cinnamivorans DSM 12816]|uniref:Uncharacterized protein n=1 Tax=Papillibacter cinnamivorans DSM 12816 TaxID=1122930 RepID=A0A1W2BIP6_9FIRM|nr:hypothetical protein SAMN02745168_2238 [Papillibacter cinnamivorans DSM 12816]
MSEGVAVCFFVVCVVGPAGWAFSLEYDSGVVGGIASCVAGGEEPLAALLAVSVQWASVAVAGFYVAAAGGLDVARVVGIGVLEIAGGIARWVGD